MNKNYYQQLEERFAEYCLCDYAISCSTGTAALHLALAGLKIGKGDEVIVPEFTMIATAWAVSYLGATPIFVDCDDSLNIDSDNIVITEKTKAILVTHIYGRIFCIDKIIDIAKRHNLFIIEDACEAHGGIKRLRSNAACFSFYSNKIIHTEEGGIVITNNKELKDRITRLKCFYFGDKIDYYHEDIGYSYRMPNTMAKQTIVSLEKVEYNLKRRKEIEQLYNEYLPDRIKMPLRDVVWVYDIRLDYEKERDYLLYQLQKQGIKARPFFKPMSMQPMYYNESYKNLNAFRWSQIGIYLPVDERMKDREVKKICKIINNELKK